MSIPIIIRNRNRAVFLDTTLKSLLATKLPSDISIIVSDDCSDDEITKKYLFTNERIKINHQWSESPVWKANVGELPNIESLTGINGKIEIIQPEKKKGVRGGIFWNINYAFERFKQANQVIIIEADVVFHEDWYCALLTAFEQYEKKRGPNGDYLGLLSPYDRKGKTTTHNYGGAWRSVRKLSNGNWGCANGIGGCCYLVTREFYNRGLKSFQATYNPEQRSGDTALQALCGSVNCNIAVTVPSMIQHTGIVSLAWPTKGWRYTKNFLKPFAWKDEI